MNDPTKSNLSPIHFCNFTLATQDLTKTSPWVFFCIFGVKNRGAIIVSGKEREEVQTPIDCQLIV
jgi:hypothetical protein